MICPGLTSHEVHVPRDRHHKVSSLINLHQNTQSRFCQIYRNIKAQGALTSSSVTVCMFGNIKKCMRISISG